MLVWWVFNKNYSFWSNSCIYFILRAGWRFCSCIFCSKLHSKSLSIEDVNEWGWRLPFLFSVILAPLLYCIVTKTEESKFWAERTEQKATELVVWESEQKYKKAAFLLSFLSLYTLNFIVRNPHDVKTGEKILTRAVVIKNKRKKEKIYRNQWLI